MERASLRALLDAVAKGDRTPEQAVDALAGWPSNDLGFANLDLHRALRQDHPEVVYGEGKTAEQITVLVERLVAAGQSALVTRVDAEKSRSVCAAVPAATWHPIARVLHVATTPREPVGDIAVVCAGTSDLPVAEEAAVIAEAFGNHVSRHVDVGVAGLHRLLSRAAALRAARVVIVVAGMEGALPSVVGGLVSCPVIAVPTSVGYGAAFGGLAALLGMLNACSAGVGVVNIDNGFGAAVLASRINQRGGA